MSPDGSVIYVTGSATLRADGYDYGTVAYDATSGSRLWSARFGTPKPDYAQAIAVGPDGSTVFVTGVVGVDAFAGDYATVAYNASTGAMLWDSIYDSGSLDWASGVAVSADGSTVFVTGVGDSDYLTIAYSAASGSNVWLQTYDGPGHESDGAVSVAASPDGSTVFVTGSSWGVDTHEDYATLAYDAVTGAPLWLRRLDGPSSEKDEAYSLGVSPDGSRVFVTGFVSFLGSAIHYGTVAYDAHTGARLWQRQSQGRGSDLARSLAVCPDGSKVFVTGSTYRPGGTNEDVGAVAYDAASGSQVWKSRYDSPLHGSDAAYSVAVASDCTKVFVTGTSYGPGGDLDYATVAFDGTSGARLWVRRYDGPGQENDVAEAAAVSPEGSSVIVTGFSFGDGTGSDFTTIAYQG